MTIITVGDMGQGHRIAGGRGMTGAGDTGHSCCHIPGSDMVHMLSRCGLILMTVQTVGRVGTKGDHFGDGSDVGRQGLNNGIDRIDVPSGVMALTAVVLMVAQDIGPVAGQMAVRAFLAIGLTEITERINIHRMIDATAGQAVVMACEVGSVAVLAFATMNIRRLLPG